MYNNVYSDYTIAMIICKTCNSQFIPRQINPKKIAVHCSRKCVIQYAANLRRGKPILKARTGRNVNCLTCNSEFYAQKNLLVIGKGKYCSNKCSAKFSMPLAIEASRGKPKPGAKTGKLFNCIACQKEFYAPKNRVIKGKVKYCSRSCLAKIELIKYSAEFGFKKLNKPLHTYKSIKVNGKRIREHRWIMEKHLGRKLEKWEHVHHINDDSSDNRLENLEVLSNSDHQRKEYIFRKKLISSFSS